MKISHILMAGAIISLVAMFSYDSTDMILKFGLLALCLLIIGCFIALENDMRANTDIIRDTIRRDEIARENTKNE